MAKIYILTDGKHVGDDNNARGVAEALRKTLNISRDNIEEIDSAGIENLLASSQIKDRLICIAAGEHHLDSLSKIKNALPRATTVWSAHQYTKLLEKYNAALDVIGLPRYSLKPLENKNRFVSLPGVPHNLQKEKLRTAFNSYKDRIPESKNGYTLIMLGGDAPAPDGTIQFYTAEEAYSFGQYIALNAPKGHLLITNGPRTGKYDPKTGEVLLSHRDFDPGTGEEINTPTDAVSLAFLQALQENGMSEGADYSFYDFRFQKNGVDSAYLALLNAASRPNGYIYMAGESVSMVSEVCDFGAKGHVYVFDNNAMNENHEAAVQDLYDQGYFHRLDKTFSKQPRKENGKDAPLLSAAQSMANAVKIKTVAKPKKDIKPN